MKTTASLTAEAPSWVASRMTSETCNITVLDSDRSILAKDPGEKAHVKTRERLASRQAQLAHQRTHHAAPRYSLLELSSSALRSSEHHSSGYRHAYPSAPLSASSDARHLPEPMFPQLLEVVLLERPPLTKEHAIRGGGSMGMVLERCKLKRADIVRELEETVVRRLCIAVDNSLPRQRVLNSVMKCVSDNGLPVVVVNLDLSELLEEVDVVENRQDKVSLHAAKKALIVCELTLAVGEGHVLEREFARHYTKTVKERFARRDPETLVVIVAVEEGPKVHRDVINLSDAEIGLIRGQNLTDILGLIMQNDCDQVVRRRLAGIAGFVNKDGQLLHCCDLLVNKNAGGNPPALGGRPLREDHLFYTTGNALSSRCDYSKHMFDTQAKVAGNEPASINRRKAA